MAHRPAATAIVRVSTLVLTLLAMVVLVPPVTAAEGDDDRAAALGLEVTAGFGGQGVTGTWTPVEVRLTPGEAFAGRIIVAGRHGAGRVLDSRDIEVGAGVEKVYRFLAPPTADIQVQVVERGAEDGVTVRPRLERVDGFLVGLLGGDPAAAPPVTSPVTQQRAVYVPLDERVLELGPQALEALAVVVVDGTTLASLEDGTRAVLSAATAAGGQLVVTGPESADLGLPWSPITAVAADGLEPAPAAWGASPSDLVPADDPGGATATTVAAARAGRGRITVSTIGLGEPDAGSDARYWEHVLQPGVLAQPDLQPSRVDRVNEDLSGAFVSAIGDLPSIGLLALFLAVYVVVVGPVTAALLSRRRRKELAWVVIPAVTAVFAVAGFIGAAGSRPSIGSSGRAAYWINDVGTTVAAASVRSPQAGTHTVALPGAGWQVLGAGWDSETHIHHDATVTRVDLTLGPQSPGLMVGWHPVDQPAPLAVEAAVVGDEVRLEITNRTAEPLTDIGLLAATDHHALAATLAGGDTLVETVQLPAQLPAQGDPAGPFHPFRPFQGPEAETGPETMASLLRWSVLAGHPGIFWITAESAGDLGLGTPSIDGRQAADRGTFVAVGVPPAPTDDATHAFEVQRDVLVPTGGVDLWREGPLRVSGSGTALVRFRLPREGSIESLEMDLRRGVANGGFGRPVPEPPPPFEQDLPDCPPDAVSCVFDGNMMEACFPDGSCEAFGIAQPTEPLPPPDVEIDPLPGGGGLQIWDQVDGRWVDLADGAGVGTTAEVDRFLSPLGEVWMRATGELFPFDASGRSVSAILGGDA